MERLLLKGNSKEDLRLIAKLAEKLGLNVQYLEDEIAYTVQEPPAATEYGALSKEQEQGIYDALEEADSGQLEDMDTVIKEFRKRYE